MQEKIIEELRQELKEQIKENQELEKKVDGLVTIIDLAIEYIDTVKTLAEVDKVNILSVSSLEKILQRKSE